MTDLSDRKPSSSIMQMIEQLLHRGESATLVTKVVGPEGVGSKLLVGEHGETLGTLGDAELDAVAREEAHRFLNTRRDTGMLRLGETSLLFERLQPPPRLVVCGAGHVGASLARLAAFAGYETTLIDDRSEFLKRERFPEKQIALVVADDWGSAVQAAVGSGAGISVAVVTRGHNEDELCMQVAVLANPDYLGLIGSKRRTSIVIDRLREAGVSEEQLKKIHAPIGLDIGAVSPEEVALAILAEIVAERRHASGGSLSAWRREKS